MKNYVIKIQLKHKHSNDDIILAFHSALQLGGKALADKEDDYYASIISDIRNHSPLILENDD